VPFLDSIKQWLWPETRDCGLCDGKLGLNYGMLKYAVLDEEMGELSQHEMNICETCADKIESGAMGKPVVHEEES
jgi:hypothetical protein